MQLKLIKERSNRRNIVEAETFENYDETKETSKKDSTRKVSKPAKKGVGSKLQSNKLLIKNALMHVCLAGSVNEATKSEVFEVSI